jgi:hypothetical protein
MLFSTYFIGIYKSIPSAVEVRKAFIRDALSLVLSVAVLNSPFPMVGLVRHRRCRG